MARQVPIVRSRTIAEIESIADGVLRRHSPSTLAGKAPFPVLGFIDGPLQEVYDMDFSVQDLGPFTEGKLENRTLILNTPVYQELLRDKNRARFTGSHEIGHALMHADELDAINDGSRGRPALHRREDMKPWMDPEWQANTFAGAVLMPLAGVRAVLSSSAWLSPALAAATLSTKFLVSQQAAEIRLNKLLQRGAIRL